MHYLNPSKESAHLIIVYRNFQAASNGSVSHIGLGVNALLTAKVLRRHKIRTDVCGVWTAADIDRVLANNPSCNFILIEAPFVATIELEKLLNKYSQVQFIVRAHSQVGFLQVEAGAIKLIREMLLLQESVLNLTVSANSAELTHFIKNSYHSKCLYLPNLYDLTREKIKHQESHNHKLLKISSFGSLRLLKLHTSALAAAMVIAESRNCDLEFYVNVNRVEHGKGIHEAMVQMVKGLRWAKLVDVPWESWPEFRRTIGQMDLCLQLSATETFNLVTADSVAEGCPIVVSPAISWAPNDTKCNIDDVADIARVGNYALNDRYAPERNFEALKRYTKNGIEIWINYLSNSCYDQQII